MEANTAMPLFAAPRGNEKIWSILCHISVFSVGIGLLLPLAVYLAYRQESSYATDNAREALNFHLSLLLYSLCCIPLVLLFGLGIVLLIALGLGSLLLGIIAAVKTSDGASYRYPLTIRFVK
ncbi:MAG TPA: DUF4870 domain-containing protein [Lacunisphaera sp.]|nr:DUF4870 domain-containing protein [Lacunisphaera sp.]